MTPKSGSTSSLWQKTRVVLPIAILLAIAARVPAASAGSTVGSFEIDGDLAVDHSVPPVEPIDWLSTPFPASLTTFTDATGQGDDIFGLGSKENDQSTWVCTTGSAPQKDDIVNQLTVPQSSTPVAGEVAFRFVGSKQFLYANWSRLSNNGDAHIDYEFNQLDAANSPASPACSQLAKRTAGDFLISFDTDLQHNAISVSAFVWNGTTFVQLAIGSQGVLWDGAVNQGPITGLTPLNTSLSNVSNLFGELALDVTDTIGTIPCNEVLHVSMKSRSSTSITAELKDRTRALPVNFTVFNPNGANANGNAYAAQITDQVLGLNQTLPAATPAGCTQGVCSSQSGPGSNSNSNQALGVPPPSQPLLKAGLLTASSTSTVDPTTNTASDTGTAESAGVNIEGGLVTADVVRAVATANAGGFNASFSAAGSAFQNLVVNNTQLNNVNPNTRIDLPAAVFGSGSYVALLEESGSISQPSAGQITGGTFAADLALNMIHVHITGVLGGVDAADVIVSHATAHADFPQPTGCPALVGTVSGNAAILNEQTDPTLLPLVFGQVQIPPQGGHDHQDLDQLTTAAANSGTSVSDSSGSVTGTSSTSTSFAQAQNVCVAPTTTGGCAVSATAIRSQANSTSGGGTSSSNSNGTSLLGVTVGPTSVSDNPLPNTCINAIPDVSVVLNEQVCDGAGAPPCSAAGAPVTCSGTTSSGLTVRAIHVIVTKGGTLGLPAGANIKVGEAHGDSSHP
jgi:hypothetical protein